MVTKIIKKRHQYFKYQCNSCKKFFESEIPAHLSSAIQYGKRVKAQALSYILRGYVSLNRVKSMISGATKEEINISEGYLCKLIRKSADSLSGFMDELYAHVRNLNILYWDDTVISVNTMRSCIPSMAMIPVRCSVP